MAFYTWTSNADPRNRTGRVSLRSGSLMLELGRYADLTQQEIDYLTAQGVVLTPGIVGGSTPSTAAPPSSPMPAITRIDGASHSGMIGGYTGGGENSYFKRLAKALGARKCGWLSAGGSVACWPTANAGTDGGYSWILNMFQPPNSSDGTGGYLPHTNVAVIQHGAEDLFALGSLNLKAYKEALKTEISRYCSSALYDDADPSWAYSTSPAFSSGAAGSNWTYSGGGFHFTQNLNAWAEWTIPSDYPGGLVIAIGLGVFPGAVGSGFSATYGLTVDGAAYDDVVINHDKGGQADAENGKTNGIVLRLGRPDCGLRIPLTAAHAGKKIRLTYKSSTGAGNPFFIVDYAQIEADPLDGPLVVLPSGFWRLPSYAGLFTVAGGWPHGSDASVDPLNDAAVMALIAAQQEVMADFPYRCVYVDVDSAINKDPKYLAADGVHPSNRGHHRIARACLETIRATGLLTDRLASSVGQRQLGPFDGGVWRTIGGVYGTGANQTAFTNTWAQFGSVQQYAAYEIGNLVGRMRARGIIKQAGAGAAGSAIVTFGIGGSPAGTGNFHEQAISVYNGTTFAIANARVNAGDGVGGQRNLTLTAGGVTAAGSYVSLNGLDWPAEA